MDERVLIVGFSTRALAESASRAGHPCLSVDAFGDLDQKSRVRNLGLRRDLGLAYTPARAVEEGLKMEADEAAYVGSFENHPGAVARLARRRRLLGNSPATLRKARDPRCLARAVAEAGERVPETRLPGDAPPPPTPGVPWLRKPARGGGGAGVREWRGAPAGPGDVLQERVDGTLFSVSFVADGRSAMVLGFSEGLAGDRAFGAPPFRYCGSLFPFSPGEGLSRRIGAVVEETTRAFGLVGLNGIDCILREGVPFVLELNPRYSASMELLERCHGWSLFRIHRDSFDGTLPARPIPEPREGVFGKAVLWARKTTTVGDTRRLLGRDDVRDLPFPGDVIPKGHPICTVFAEGPTRAACYERLKDAAARLETA
jgi:predicted ATP-grasp superfamily ATP-dependent carboligase